MKNYIRFAVATYALPLVICALHNSGIIFSITQEDNHLVVSIEAEYLENIVYGNKTNTVPQIQEALENEK